MVYVLRWFALGPGVLAAFVTVGLLAVFVSDAVGVWNEPVVGAAGAVVFVFAGYLLAPAFTLEVATCALIAGAILAWQLIPPPSFYPETYGAQAYTPTYLPIVATYGAGLMSWCACFVWSRRRVRLQ